MTTNIDKKTQFISFRVTNAEFKEFSTFAKFLFEKGAIKSSTVPCLTRSILFTEINKFRNMLVEAHQKIVEQERQAAAQVYNQRMKQLESPFPNISQSVLTLVKV
jgi:DNA polymerase III alpha subunit